MAEQTLHGITYRVESLPALDSGFMPLPLFFRAHQKLAQRPFAVALHRGENDVSVYETRLIGDEAYGAADEFYLDRLLKTLLSLYGAHTVELCGDGALGGLGARLQQAYTPSGTRGFEYGFFTRVYGRPFAMHLLPYGERPAPRHSPVQAGGHFEGCRIGFDAGGSDRKVSAVIDGQTVYSEEVVWFPRENSDPQYHYDGILAALQTAASKMPRVDAIGVSSAGVFVDNRVRVSYLFDKVSQEEQRTQVEDIFIRAARAIGPDISLRVVNDGEVTALAGAMGLKTGRILGIAMGTGEGAGYVDAAGNLTGWINEPGLAPLDARPDALHTHWSGEVGSCSEFLCQDGVLWLARQAGIGMQGASKAQRLKEMQALANDGDGEALAAFRDMGVYLGHALGLYDSFYDIGRVLMMGRVTSGLGGDLMLAEAARVLKADYPHIAYAPEAPDEMARRVGQSVAAASL